MGLATLAGMPLQEVTFWPHNQTSNLGAHKHDMVIAASTAQERSKAWPSTAQQGIAQQEYRWHLACPGTSKAQAHLASCCCCKSVRDDLHCRSQQAGLACLKPLLPLQLCSRPQRPDCSLPPAQPSCTTHTAASVSGSVAMIGKPPTVRLMGTCL